MTLTMTTQYLDVLELAVILGKSPDTIRQNVRRRPWLVPPNIHIPQARMLRWRASDVEAWMAERKQGSGHGEASAEATTRQSTCQTH